MSVAWDMAEHALGTNLLTGTTCQEELWPTGWIDFDEHFRMVQLDKALLVSVDSVTINHELYDCDCGVQELAGCAVIYSHRYSQIRLVGCRSLCGTCSAAHPFSIEICYTAGLWPSLEAIPKTVKMALWLLYRWSLGVLDSGGESVHDDYLTAWRSMDYSESQANIDTLLGQSPEAAAAMRLLRPYRVRRAVSIRGHYNEHRGGGYSYGAG